MGGPARLQHTVKVLTTIFRDRNIFSLGTMHKCTEYLRNRLGRDRLFEQKVEAFGLDSNNLFSTFKKDDSRDIFVIGAHYDSEATSRTPGADDNASGVSVVIEIAERLAKMPSESLKYNVILALYTNEEWPFFKTQMMGSYNFTSFLKQNDYNVLGSISLDMVGRFERKQTYPWPLGYFYPKEGNFLASIGDRASASTMKSLREKSNLPIENLYVPRSLETFHRADHWSFWANDFPGILVTDTADYRHEDYHSVNDTWEKLDYERMDELATALVRLVYED